MAFGQDMKCQAKLVFFKFLCFLEKFSNSCNTLGTNYSETRHEDRSVMQLRQFGFGDFLGIFAFAMIVLQLCSNEGKTQLCFCGSVETSCFL